MPADPVQVDPKHYRVVFENERIRVLRIRYAPGEKSVMHAHPDYLSVNLTDAHVRFAFPHGKVSEFQVKAGDVHWHRGGEHQPENIGDEPLEVVLVEFKS
jgi:quercetin dioxygenase-like cupin family protein